MAAQDYRQQVHRAGGHSRQGGRHGALGIAERGAATAFEVVSNPEFLKEGAAVADCKRPDRIVIGTASATAERQLRELYSPFNRNHDTGWWRDGREERNSPARCQRHARDFKISFINEIANPS